MQGKKQRDVHNYPSLRSNGEHSREQARAEAGELPQEDRPTWANSVDLKLSEQKGILD